MFYFPQIKGQPVKAIGFFLLVTSLAGCGGSSSEPMPFDAETLERLTYHFEEVFEAQKDDIRSIDNKRIRARTLVADVYQLVIDELGYDFDLTMRHYRFYRQETNSRNPWRQQMDEAYLYFRNNYTDAYDHGLISKEAFDLFEFEEKAGGDITDHQLKILDYIVKCQEQHDGVCTASVLNTILPQDAEGFHALVPSVAGWITTETGFSGSSAVMAIRESGGTEGFTVDAERLELSRLFAKMLEEEKQTLGLAVGGE